MKKIYLLFLLLLTFSVSSLAQSLPKPATPEIWEWCDYDNGTSSVGITIIEDFDGDPVADDYVVTDEWTGGEWTKLDPDKLFYRIYIDNDELFVFTPEDYPQFTEPVSEIPYRYTGGAFLPVEIHFTNQSNITPGMERFFNWRIGIQAVYKDGDQVSYSDIYYMEIFPQLKPATEVTSTSFLADWTHHAENTFIINNFPGGGGYDLYVINKATQDTIVINDVVPTDTVVIDAFGNKEPLPGASYLVEGLTPGATYEYYVVVRQNDSFGTSYQSVVREVTLPMSLVMLPADDGFVTPTSFRADWTDATDPSLIQDYTLYVTKAAGETLLTETFSQSIVDTDQNTNIASYLNQYCDNEGWTGSYAYQAADGGLKMGNSSNGGVLTSPALDLTESGGIISVSFNGKYYNTDKTVVTISCGDVSETVELTDAAADYTVVLNGVPETAGQKVTISSTGSRKRYYVYEVTVETGNATAANEPMVFPGVTGNSYTVENLTPGTTYDYYVVANYTDGTTATSNTEQVTLLPPAAPELIADPEIVTMNANYGEVVTATFDVLGADLIDNVILILDDDTEMFSITPSTIGIADAEAGATVTVTYSPTEVGEHTATVTISSVGAEDVIVTLNGTTVMEATAPVMLPANEEYITETSFRADWTDETPAANVVDYTLYVNIKPETPEPAALLLNETFYTEDAPASDGNADIGESLDDYCDNPGWTGYAVYRAGGGGMKLSSGTKTGYLTSPALDMTNCEGKVTVNFNAKSYGNDNSSIIVKCGEVADTIQLTAEAADYSVVLDGVTAAEGQNVTLSGVRNGKRLYIYGVQIYNGEKTREVVETGDANSRVITGITEKYYVVENLTPGATYEYYVEANYVNNTKAASNVEEVTLLSATHIMPGDVNHDGKVDVSDITAMIALVLGNETDACTICANVNGDDKIDVSDVTAAIAMVLEAN